MLKRFFNKSHEEKIEAEMQKLKRTGFVKFFESRVYVTPNSHLYKELLKNGHFELAICKLITTLLKPNSFFFDIGANIGLISIHTLCHRPDINVVSFEPSANVLPYLRQTVKHSYYNQQKRWSLIEKAVGEKTGSTYFNLNKLEGKDAFDGIKNTGRGGDKTAIVEVPMTTIDEEWKRLNYPNLSVIKIDTEGYDYWVLQGAKNCITKCRPACIVEWNFENLLPYDLPLEKIFDFCKEHKYALFAVNDLRHITTIIEMKVRFYLQNQENFLLLPVEWAL
jgi:FkbM family methyltransferase